MKTPWYQQRTPYQTKMAIWRAAILVGNKRVAPRKRRASSVPLIRQRDGWVFNGKGECLGRRVELDGRLRGSHGYHLACMKRKT